MTALRRPQTGPLIFVAIVATGGLLLVIGLGIMFFFRQTAAVPDISILQPSGDTILTSGQGVMVIAEGQAPSGVQRIEFYVNDSLVSQHTTSQGTEEAIQAAFPWFSNRTGIQKISVIAYDAQGRTSEPASLLVAVKAAEVPQLAHHVVDEQSLLGEAEDTESQPGEEPADGQNQLGGGEASQIGSADADSQGGQDLVEGQDQPEGVNENDQSLDDGQIADLLDQVDEDGGFPQDLPDQPMDEPPVAFIFSNAARLGERLDVVGSAQADDDVGLDYMAVEIFANGILSETQRIECVGELHCARDYSFNLNAGETRTIIVAAYDTSGQSSEIIKEEYQIINGEGNEPPAFVVSEDFNANEIQVVNDQVEQREENGHGRGGGNGDDYIGNPRVVEFRCSDEDSILLEVDYRYFSNHGDQVYVGAWVEKGNTMVAAGHTLVVRNTSGRVPIELEGIAPDLVESTEQLRLYFMTTEGNYFNESIVDLLVNWTWVLPDLHITEVTRRVDGKTIDVEVSNKGCAPVDGFWIATHVWQGHVDWSGYHERFILHPGFTETVTIENLDPNLYSLTFTVRVDPDNEIQEIDEFNNTHFVRPITVKYVYFDAIDIHNTLEDGDLTEDSETGEFIMRACVNGECANIPRDGKLELMEGGYNMETLMGSEIIDTFSPSLNWYDYLHIDFMIYEFDDFSGNETGRIEFTHSPNILLEKIGKWVANLLMLTQVNLGFVGG